APPDDLRDTLLLALKTKSPMVAATAQKITEKAADFKTNTAADLIAALPISSAPAERHCGGYAEAQRRATLAGGPHDAPLLRAHSRLDAPMTRPANLSISSWCSMA